MKYMIINKIPKKQREYTVLLVMIDLSPILNLETSIGQCVKFPDLHTTRIDMTRPCLATIGDDRI